MMILEFQSGSTINTRTESSIIEITCKGGRTEMNEIIDRISEIEAASAAIIEDANQKKKEFADLMEQRMKEFDIQTETETEKKLASLKQALEEKTEQELARLKSSTLAVQKALRETYRKNHTAYAEQILTGMIKG